MTLAVLDGGTFYHHETIYGERYRGLFDQTIYAPELTPSTADVGLLIVPDGCIRIFSSHASTLIDFRAAGAPWWCSERTSRYLGARRKLDLPPDQFLVVGRKGCAAEQQLAPEHELFRSVPFENTIWHFHGVLFPPRGAQALIDVPADPQGRDKGGALLYEDRGRRAAGSSSRRSILSIITAATSCRRRRNSSTASCHGRGRWRTLTGCRRDGLSAHQQRLGRSPCSGTIAPLSRSPKRRQRVAPARRTSAQGCFP